MIAEKENPNNLTCEACGQAFSCGAQAGICWCFDTKLDSSVLADLRERYNNCLCPNCLKNKIELLLPRPTPAEN